jgi:FkbM family methyltransferase
LKQTALAAKRDGSAAMPGRFIKRDAVMDAIETRLSDIERRVGALERRDNSAPAADDRVSDADIRAAYRIFLGREADESGMDHYRGRAASGDFGHKDLIWGMTDCEEYRSKNAREIMTIEVAGTTVAIDPQEPEFGRAIAEHGVWEPHIIAAIASGLREGDVFVDVGANVGIMSFQAARAVGPGGRIIAFEPNPENVQRFLQGMLLNRFENISLYPFAASDDRAIFSMQGHSNTYLVDASTGGRLVQSLPLDTILVHEPRIDFIKIDIEGHELYALAGMRATLARHRPLVLCEFNPRCLSDNGHVAPEAMAQDIFELTRSVELVEHDHGRTRCSSADELMHIWHKRNASHAADGTLPDGMLHFDLLFRVAA